MKSNIIFLLLLFITFVSCKSSYTKIGGKNANYIPYYLKVYEADSLYLTNNFEQSYEILDSLFKKYEPINIDGYYEYEIYTASAVMSNNFINLRSKFKKAHKKYGSIYAQGLHWNSAVIADSISKYVTFSKKKIEKFKNIYISSLNLELRSQIIKMNEEDTSVREVFNDEVGQNYYKEKHKKELLELMKNYGYPEKSLIGHNNLNLKSDEEVVNLEIILIHQSTYFKELVLPLLLENVKKGKVNPELYAVVYDRMVWEKSKNESMNHYQYYGSYTGDNLKVQFPKKIDSIRISIGLPKSPNYVIWRNKKIFNN